MLLAVLLLEAAVMGCIAFQTIGPTNTNGRSQQARPGTVWHQSRFQASGGATRWHFGAEDLADGGGARLLGTAEFLKQVGARSAFAGAVVSGLLFLIMHGCKD